MLNFEDKKYVSSAFAVAILTLASQVLGYVREILFAFFLGASSTLEAFQAAETVPLMFTQILISAMPLALTPLLVKERENNEDNYMHNAVTILFPATLLISIILVVFPESLSRIVGAGFSEKSFFLTCRIVTILAPNIVFLSMISLFNAFLNAKEQFIIPSVLVLTQNISVIAAQIITKANVLAVAHASASSGLFMIVVTIYICYKKYGFRFKKKRINKIIVKQIVMAVIPVCSVAAITSLNLMFDKYFASQMPEGSIASMTYGYKIINIPVYIFITSVTRVMMPKITELFLKEEKEKVSTLVKKTVIMCLALGIVIGIGIYIFADVIVAILFGRGAFDSDAIHLTAMILRFYSIGMIGMMLNPFFQSITYANQDFFKPLKVLAIQIGLYLLIAYNASKYAGVIGIVMGNVVSLLFSVVIWIVVLKKDYEINLFRRKSKC